MGLDISVYTNLKKCDDQSIENETYDVFIHNSDYPTHAEPLDDQTHYNGDRVHSFRAGSYSGYNAWRNWLSETMLGVSADTVWRNEVAYSSKPFFGLINFSDCEGDIGSVLATKLAKDFQDHQHIVDALGEDWNYFKGSYAEWRKAFELASDNGVVYFH